MPARQFSTEALAGLFDPRVEVSETCVYAMFYLHLHLLPRSFVSMRRHEDMRSPEDIIPSVGYIVEDGLRHDDVKRKHKYREGLFVLFSPNETTCSPERSIPLI
jgi:hypothetical protein